MKEYTILAIASVIITIVIDRLSGVNILKRPLFYLFLAVIVGFKLLVNGFLTGKSIVMYTPNFSSVLGLAVFR